MNNLVTNCRSAGGTAVVEKSKTRAENLMYPTTGSESRISNASASCF